MPESPAHEEQDLLERDEGEDAAQRHPEFKLLTKDESKAIMLTKEFEQFMSKTSKMVERALDGGEDVIGPSHFFEEVRQGEDGDDDLKGMQMSMQSKEKLIPLFTFQESVVTNRTITSIEWSQKVREFSITMSIGERSADVHLQQISRVEGR